MSSQTISLVPLTNPFASLARRLVGLVAVLVAPTLLAVGCAWMNARPDALALVSTVTLIGFSYTLDHALDRKLGRVVAIGFGAAHLATVVATIASGRTMAALLLVVLPLSILPYARPCFDVKVRGRTCRRVKDLPYVKPLYCAALWALFAVLAAASSASPIPVASVLLSAAWIFGKVVVNITISDFRDVRTDREEGVASWPVLLGERRARVLAHLVNVAFAVAALAAVAAGLAPRAVLWFELVAVLHAGSLVLLAQRDVSRALIADVLVDGGTLLLLLVGLAMCG